MSLDLCRELRTFSRADQGEQDCNAEGNFSKSGAVIDMIEFKEGTRGLRATLACWCDFGLEQGSFFHRAVISSRFLGYQAALQIRI